MSMVLNQMARPSEQLLDQQTQIDVSDNESESQVAVDGAVTEIDIDISAPDSASELPGGLLLIDDSLLPLLQQFADALRSLDRFKTEFKLTLFIGQVQIPSNVLNLLAPALEALPPGYFALYNNRLGSDGIKFVANLLEANSSIKLLSLDKNNMELGLDRHVTFSLTEAVRKHTRVTFRLCKCSLESTIPVFIPAILNASQVILKETGIGSRSASLISASLANNPSIMYLNLDGNMFDDDDATLFAAALKKNTHLKELSLRENDFTNTGIMTLIKPIFDDQSLNAIFDSNCTCALKLFDEDTASPNWLDPSVLLMNEVVNMAAIPQSTLMRYARAAHRDVDIAQYLVQIVFCRKTKMLHALMGGDAGLIKMHYLGNMPVEIMPNVLAFLQESGVCSGSEERNLDRLFQLVSSNPQVVMSCCTAEKKVKDQEGNRSVAIAATLLALLLGFVRLMHSQK